MTNKDFYKRIGCICMAIVLMFILLCAFMALPYILPN